MRRALGFTLIETLVYLGLFTIIMGGGLVAAYQLMSAADSENQKAAVEQEGNFLLRKFDWALSGLCQINIPATPGSAATLSIDKTNFGQNPLFFDLSGDAVQLTRAGGSAVPLTSARVKVTSLNFDRLAVAGQPEAVRVSFTMNGRPFTTTQFLRKETTCP
jgi:type II secretory pathway pseudopilin PulG